MTNRFKICKVNLTEKGMYRISTLNQQDGYFKKGVGGKLPA